MHKLKEMILMLCFILSGALSYAHGEARMENAKGEDIPIEVIEKACHGGEEKGNWIIASVNGHVLTVLFDKNLGQVSVEVATFAGVTVDCLSVLTPNGLQFYIPKRRGIHCHLYTFQWG